MAAERLVDYFLEVVAETRDGEALGHSARDAMAWSDSSGGWRAGDQQQRGGLEHGDAYERRVARRIPWANHADFPLPDGVPFVRALQSQRRCGRSDARGLTCGLKRAVLHPGLRRAAGPVGV
jgi:hypothetical protein